jgi:hypothetical protein
MVSFNPMMRLVTAFMIRDYSAISAFMATINGMDTKVLEYEDKIRKDIIE